ncbi:hypothetical protein TNCV_4056681 [Trichonephila clavipes]|nr:hypothetical protein TNCV_4056681 [Trichonephila clavipes]
MLTSTTSQREKPNRTSPALHHPSFLSLKKITDMRGKGKKPQKVRDEKSSQGICFPKKIEALLSTQEGKVPVTPVNEPPLATESLLQDWLSYADNFTPLISTRAPLRYCRILSPDITLTTDDHDNTIPGFPLASRTSSEIRGQIKSFDKRKKSSQIRPEKVTSASFRVLQKSFLMEPLTSHPLPRPKSSSLRNQNWKKPLRVGCDSWKRRKGSPAYKKWKILHVKECLKNHNGSAGMMETVGMVRIFQRSLSHRSVRYTSYRGWRFQNILIYYCIQSVWRRYHSFKN